jgi:hypothetical protein
MTTAAPFADLARRGQEAATAAADTFTNAVRAYADTLAANSRSFDLQVAVAATFDLAEKLLRGQREFVTAAVSAATQAAEAATEQATRAGASLAAKAEEATERVVDLAAETTRRTSRAARNGVTV